MFRRVKRRLFGPYPPKYRIELEGNRFYIWKGCSLVDSRYGFVTVLAAAEAAIKARSDLIEAWELIHK